jgi:trehalose utilization protein
MSANAPRVTVWNECRHEKLQEEVLAIYPKGIHEAIAKPLHKEGFAVRTATLDEPDHGLPQRVLDETEVLLWWGHTAHDEVRDEVVERVQKRILAGMGFVALHSAHESKIFKKLMGTTCKVIWRELGERERIWVIDPAHPIAAGLPEHFEILKEEMYGEPTDIPSPEELVFISWFEGGEVFRTGGCYRRGRGKIFYFRPARARDLPGLPPEGGPAGARQRRALGCAQRLFGGADARHQEGRCAQARAARTALRRTVIVRSHMLPEGGTLSRHFGVIPAVQGTGFEVVNHD